MNVRVSGAVSTALGLLACVNITDAADLPSASILAPLGQAAIYESSFDGHFWNGEKRHADDKIELRVTTPSAATISNLGTSGVVPPTTCNIGPGGSLDLAQPTPIVLELNAANALLSGLSASPEVGSSWRSAVRVRTSPSSTTLLPVDVRVAAVDGNGILLQATGTSDASMTYIGMTIPLTLSVRMAEMIRKSTVSRAQASFTEHIDAGPFSQDMGWQWTLVNASPS